MVQPVSLSLCKSMWALNPKTSLLAIQHYILISVGSSLESGIPILECEHIRPSSDREVLVGHPCFWRSKNPYCASYCRMQ